MIKNAQQEIVSIIVPIYNAQPYLNDCFLSINNSTYNNIQIVLIDDGSDDDSLSFMQSFKFKTNNVIIKHINHSGVSIARNEGLKYACGKYVYYLDSDDIMHPNAISYFVNELENDSSLDLVGASFTKIHSNVSYKDIKFDRDNYTTTLYKDDDIIPQILKGWNTTPNWSIWNKLFRTSILKKINSYPTIIEDDIFLAEDMYFLAGYLKHTKKALFINKDLYFHKIRKDSLSHAKYCDKEITVMKCLKPLSDIDQTALPNSYIAVKAMECFNAFNLIHRIKKNNNLTKSQLLDLKQMFIVNFPYTKQFRSSMKLFRFMKIAKPFTKHRINKLISKK